LRRALEGISAAQAARRPLPDAHSIWELVRHIAAWENVAIGRIEGRAIKEPEEGDFPGMEDKSASAWEQALSRLNDTHERLIARIADLSDTRLETRVAGTGYSVRHLLRGIICHHAYHSGQIALLKKS
jgi:uncharacterized damage-inducible protein DinB